jgi:hypothetical protein
MEAKCHKNELLLSTIASDLILMTPLFFPINGPFKTGGTASILSQLRSRNPQYQQYCEHLATIFCASAALSEHEGM